VPPHVVLAFGVPAMTTPLGNPSLTATPVSATAPDAVFAIVSVSADVPLTGIVAGVNAFDSVTLAR